MRFPVGLQVKLGFGLALVVLGLGALGSFWNVRGLVGLVEKGQQIPGVGDQLEEVRAEVSSRASRAGTLALLAFVLSLLIAGFSLVLRRRDLAARHQAEEALRQAQANLENRVVKRTEELARANEVLRLEIEERHGIEELRQKIEEHAQAEWFLRETLILQCAILDSANYAILSTDPDGTIRTFNAAAERWLGYSAQEIVGSRTPALFHDPNELARQQQEIGDELGLPIDPEFEVLVTRARLGVPDEREWTYVRKGGSRFPVLLSVTALQDETETVSGFLFIGSDIAERKRSEEELRRAKEAAEEANLAKSKFLANMSHELRTPLNSVIGFANILLKNKAGNLRDQDLVFLQRVLDNGKHLLELINQVLDLAKVEAGRMELEAIPVSLNVLIGETLAQLEGQVRDKGVKLHTELPSPLLPLATDSVKLKQVLINLVVNAIKFTDQGTVTVRVRTEPATGNPLALEVVDTGIGIPEEQLERIFEAFQQVDLSSARKYGGTGLGLTIARSLCRLMGYRLEAQSRVGVGSTFRIVFKVLATRETGSDYLEVPLPLIAPTPGEAGWNNPGINRGWEDPLIGSPHFRLEMNPSGDNLPSGLSSRLVKGQRVLVIDDDADSRLLLTQYLEDWGCEVTATGSGVQGLTLAEKNQPDLILLDLIMPGMTGWEVLKALKAHPLLGRVPVVVVSIIAHENRGTILGAVDLLDKPVSREALAEVLDRNLIKPRGKVLIVDDSPDDRRLVAQFLAEEGFQVREAREGSDALRQLEDYSPDLVILDLLMPVMDGLTFLEAWRRHPAHQKIVVIVLTAKDLSPQETLHLKQAAAAILTKNQDLPKGLSQVIKSILPPKRTH